MSQTNAPSVVHVANQASKSRQKVKKGRRFRWLALALFTVGAALLLFRGFVTDYSRAMFADDGVYVPQATHSFAGEKAGEVSNTFRIYNARPRRLSVEAQPDCGCTGVSWERATIAPFGWKDLTAKMRLEKPQMRQERSVSIGLHTDSPNRKWLFMFLKS